MIPCLIISRGGNFSFYFIFSTALASSKVIPILSHLSLSNYIYIYRLALLNSSFSFFLYTSANYSSCSYYFLFAAATSLSIFIRFNSISLEFFFSSSYLFILAALIFSSAILIRSSLLNSPIYSFFKDPYPS